MDFPPWTDSRIDWNSKNIPDFLSWLAGLPDPIFVLDFEPDWHWTTNPDLDQWTLIRQWSRWIVDKKIGVIIHERGNSPVVQVTRRTLREAAPGGLWEPAPALEVPTNAGPAPTSRLWLGEHLGPRRCDFLHMFPGSKATPIAGWFRMENHDLKS